MRNSRPPFFIDAHPFFGGFNHISYKELRGHAKMVWPLFPKVYKRDEYGDLENMPENITAEEAYIFLRIDDTI